jgi:hypothetical protein
MITEFTRKLSVRRSNSLSKQLIETSFLRRRRLEYGGIQDFKDLSRLYLTPWLTPN